MTETPSTPLLDDLLRHMGWLRRLARSLVLDQDRADDLVQDTCLTALEHPPRRQEGLRAWLSCVLLNRLRDLLRRERRHAAREKTAATKEATASTSDVVERAELQRRLAEAVVRLAEPYRTTLLLRYFDDLAPKEIARRLNLPGATVRVRLKRGLDLLREHFDREHGGNRKAWCQLMLPLAAAGTGTQAAAGVTLGLWRMGIMSSKIKVLLGGASSLVIALMVWRLVLAPSSESREGEVAAAIPSASASEMTGASPALQHVAEASDSGGKPVRAAIREPATISQSAGGVLLYGAILDTEGEPLRDVDVTLGRVSDDTDAIRASDLKGTYAIAGLEPGVWKVQANRTGYDEFEGGIVLEPSTAQRRYDIVLAPSALLNVRLVTPSGGPFEEIKIPGLRWPLSRLTAVVATKDAPGETLPMNARPSHLYFGVGRYHSRADMRGGRGAARIDIPTGYSGVLELSEPLPLYVSVAFKHVILDTRLVTRLDQDLTLVVDPEVIDKSRVSLELRLVDAESGAPIEMADVQVSDSVSVGGGSKTGADGRVRIDNIEPGIMEFRIERSDYEVIHQEIWLEAGVECDLGEVALFRATAINGILVDPDGNPVTGGVGFRNLDRLIMPQLLNMGGSYSTEETGEFHIRGAGRGRHLLFARWGGDEWAVNPTLVDTAGGPVDGVKVELRRGTKVSVRPAVTPERIYLVSIQDSAGIPVWTCRVWGGGATAVFLLPGNYTVTVWDERTPVKVTPFKVRTEPVAIAVNPTGAAIERAAGEAAAALAEPTPASAGEAQPQWAAGDDPVGLVLTGTITDLAGNAIPKASVTVTNLEGESHWCQSYKGSSYAIAGLSPGRWQLTAKAPSFVEHREWIELDGGGSFQRVDISLKPTVELEVRFVTPDGRDLGESLPADLAWHGLYSTILTVVATREPLAGDLPPNASVSWLGIARFQDGMRRGDAKLLVDEAPPFYACALLGNRILETVRVTDPALPLTFVIDPARLGESLSRVRVKVVDGVTGDVLRPVKIAAHGRGVAYFSRMPNPPVFNDDGSITLERVVPGARGMTIEVEGYGRYRYEIMVPAMATLDLGTLRLNPQAHIRGVFVDEQGKAVACSFEVRDLDLESRLPGQASLSLHGTTDAQPAAGFDVSCGRGCYAIVVKGEEWARATVEVNTSGGDVDNLRIQVARGVPVLLDIELDGQSVSRLMIRDASARLVWSTSLGHSYLERLRLVPGSYTLSVEGGGRAPRTIPLNVGDEPVELRVVP
ncbi:MAG: sigma-70 family RNA polymerase sigma factor [Planctomycetota bacterium]